MRCCEDSGELDGGRDSDGCTDSGTSGWVAEVHWVPSHQRSCAAPSGSGCHPGGAVIANRYQIPPRSCHRGYAICVAFRRAPQTRPDKSGNRSGPSDDPPDMKTAFRLAALGLAAFGALTACGSGAAPNPSIPSLASTPSHHARRAGTGARALPQRARAVGPGPKRGAGTARRVDRRGPCRTHTGQRGPAVGV